ncbi:MAG: hypothetical protein SVX38_11750 [Chloroflexota bacterium]|nr:hypothetical protein [Chloroflexota bacterium]
MLRFTSNPASKAKQGISQKRVHLIALVGVAVALLLCIMGVGRTADQLADVQSLATRIVGGLVSSRTIGQTFVAEYTDLFRIEVKLSNYGRSSSGPLVFHLKADPEASDDLITLTLNAADIQNNAYHVFEFPPIHDSAGQAFYFYLEAPGVEPNDAIGVWGTAKDAYSDGEAVLHGVPTQDVRDLTFRLRYRLSWWQVIGIILDRLASHKPSLWGNPWFYGFLGVSYLLLLYAFFVQVAQATLSADEDEAQ